MPIASVKKGVKKAAKSRKKKAKTQAHNERKLTEAEHKKVIDFDKARRDAERLYGGKSPARIRDDKRSQTLTIGDMQFALDISAVPNVRVHAVEAGVPRKGGAKRAVKTAAKTGVYKRQNH